MPEFVPNFEAIAGSILTPSLCIEQKFPLRQAQSSKTRRFLINMGISGLALGTGAYFVAPIAFTLSKQSAETSFGFLHVFPLAPAAEFVLGFLAMDLTFYYWHRANHSIPSFWRFHNVHHVDPDLDVSTSFRFHFGKVLYWSWTSRGWLGGIRALAQWTVSSSCSSGRRGSSGAALHSSGPRLGAILHLSFMVGAVLHSSSDAVLHLGMTPRSQSCLRVR